MSSNLWPVVYGVGRSPISLLFVLTIVHQISDIELFRNSNPSASITHGTFPGVVGLVIRQIHQISVHWPNQKAPPLRFELPYLWVGPR